MANCADEDVGLRDASGACLAQMIRDDFHLAAFNQGVVSWDEIKVFSAAGPVAIGGRTWGPAGHWTAVRRVNESSDLDLANPASNTCWSDVTGSYRGIDETMSQEQFESVGPCSAVWIDHRIEQSTADLHPT